MFGAPLLLGGFLTIVFTFFLAACIVVLLYEMFAACICPTHRLNMIRIGRQDNEAVRDVSAHVVHIQPPTVQAVPIEHGTYSRESPLTERSATIAYAS